MIYELLLSLNASTQEMNAGIADRLQANGYYPPEALRGTTSSMETHTTPGSEPMSDVEQPSELSLGSAAMSGDTLSPMSLFSPLSPAGKRERPGLTVAVPQSIVTPKDLEELSQKNPHTYFGGIIHRAIECCSDPMDLQEGEIVLLDFDGTLVHERKSRSEEYRLTAPELPEWIQAINASAGRCIILTANNKGDAGSIPKLVDKFGLHCHGKFQVDTKEMIYLRPGEEFPCYDPARGVLYSGGAEIDKFQALRSLCEYFAFNPISVRIADDRVENHGDMFKGWNFDCPLHSFLVEPE